MFGIGADKQRMPQADKALPGRAVEMPLRNAHHVHGRPLRADFAGLQRVQFGMGCFWGAERKFWSLPGVETTAVGYAGGHTPNATYREVCSGETGHAEVVLVVYDPAVVAFEALLEVVLGKPRSHPGHAPGQRRGNAIPFGDLLRHPGAVRRRHRQSRCVPATARSMPATAAITHRDRVPGAGVLLRRRRTPAVPVEESRRLLRAFGHRRELPGGFGGVK